MVKPTSILHFKNESFKSFVIKHQDILVIICATAFLAISLSLVAISGIPNYISNPRINETLIQIGTIGCGYSFPLVFRKIWTSTRTSILSKMSHNTASNIVPLKLQIVESCVGIMFSLALIIFGSIITQYSYSSLCTTLGSYTLFYSTLSVISTIAKSNILKNSQKKKYKPLLTKKTNTIIYSALILFSIFIIAFGMYYGDKGPIFWCIKDTGTALICLSIGYLIQTIINRIEERKKYKSIFSLMQGVNSFGNI